MKIKLADSRQTKLLPRQNDKSGLLELAGPKKDAYLESFRAAGLDPTKIRALTNRKTIEDAARVEKLLAVPHSHAETIYRKYYTQRAESSHHADKIATLSAELTPKAEPIPPPGPELSTTPDIKQLRVLAQGQGSGWNSLYGDNDEKTDAVTFHYKFTPQATRQGVLILTLNLVGHYALFANDDWWDWRNAHLDMEYIFGVSSTLYGSNVFPPSSQWIDIFDDGGASLNRTGPVLPQSVQKIQPIVLVQGAEVEVYVQVYARVQAQGGNSCALLDFSQSGEGISCLLQVMPPA